MSRRRLRARKVGSERGYGLIAVTPHNSIGVAGSGRRQDGADVMVRWPGMTSMNPSHAVAGVIRDALDPVQAPGKVRTMADMTPEELAKLAPPRGRR